MLAAPNDNPILACACCREATSHTYICEKEVKPERTGDVLGHEQVFSCLRCGTLRRWGLTQQRTSFLALVN